MFDLAQMAPWLVPFALIMIVVSVYQAARALEDIRRELEAVRRTQEEVLRELNSIGTDTSETAANTRRPTPSDPRYG